MRVCYDVRPNDVRVVLSAIWFMEFMFLDAICIYLRILVYNTISISDDARVAYQLHDGCHIWSRNCHKSASPVFSGVRFSRSLVFCVMFCMSLFVFFFLFFSFGHCLSSDLQLLIIPLVSSNISYIKRLCVFTYIY